MCDTWNKVLRWRNIKKELVAVFTDALKVNSFQFYHVCDTAVFCHDMRVTHAGTRLFSLCGSLWAVTEADLVICCYIWWWMCRYAGSCAFLRSYLHVPAVVTRNEDLHGDPFPMSCLKLITRGGFGPLAPCSHKRGKKERAHVKQRWGKKTITATVAELVMSFSQADRLYQMKSFDLLTFWPW